MSHIWSVSKYTPYIQSATVVKINSHLKRTLKLCHKVGFGAEGNAPSSLEPSSSPTGPTVTQEPATRSTSLKTTPKHSKSSKPTSQTSSSCHEGQKSKSQEVSLGEKMKKGRWKSTELNGHEDLVLDCDLDVQLGLAVTCSRDTTVKVRWVIGNWDFLMIYHCREISLD